MRGNAELAFVLPAGTREEFSGVVGLRPANAPETQTPQRVSVLIQPRVGIRSPREVSLGGVASGGSRKRRVLLMAVDRLPFSITAATADDPRCRVLVAKAESAIQHWLEIEVSLTDGQPLAAQVSCRTDHPESPELALQVTAVPLPVTGTVGAASE